MDKRGLKTSLTVSIIVMFVLCIYLVYYITNNYDKSVKNNDNTIVENNSNDADILLLERYVDAFNNNCVDMKNFYGNKTLISDIDSNIKLTTVLNLSNNYTKKYIESQYKKVFNEDIDISKVTGTCPKISYNNNIVSKMDCECKNKSGVVTHFIKTVKSNSKVKLYYKVAFYGSKKYLGKETRMLSKDPSANEIIDSRVIKNNVNEIKYQDYLDNNYQDFYTYIFTFKNSDNNYYLYSIEKE